MRKDSAGEGTLARLLCIKLCFISVEFTLDFVTSNQTKINYWGRDLNALLMAKNNGFLLLTI